VTRSTVIPADSFAERLQRGVNGALTKSTGYQLTRAHPRRRPRHNRLVKQPTFVMSSVRSGSTLLRVILNSHSQICAPHELHLRVLRVTITKGFGKIAMKEMGLDERRLEHLLWDRILDRELKASGKQVIVDKTPNNVFGWARLREAWPDARFIFLLRHPAAIADSLFRASEVHDEQSAAVRINEYVEAMEEARANLEGHTVKYEELVADPARVSAELCSYLGVPWEPTMLDYGSHNHGKFAKFIGDWSPKIQSGQIDSDIVLPTDDEVPPELREASRRWGYMS